LSDRSAQERGGGKSAVLSELQKKMFRSLKKFHFRNGCVRSERAGRDTGKKGRKPQLHVKKPGPSRVREVNPSTIRRKGNLITIIRRILGGRAVRGVEKKT